MNRADAYTYTGTDCSGTLSASAQVVEAEYTKFKDKQCGTFVDHNQYTKSWKIKEDSFTLPACNNNQLTCAATVAGVMRSAQVSLTCVFILCVLLGMRL